MLPSAAKPPEWTSVDTSVRLDVVVQAETSPVSKPSANTGGPAAGVLAATGPVSAETLPDESRERTAYWWVDPARTVLSA